MSLVKAIQMHQSEAEILKLIESGHEINKTDRSGKTALYFALYNNDDRITNLLLDHGAQLSLSSAGRQNLIVLAQRNPRTIKVLDQMIFRAIRANDAKLVSKFLHLSTNFNITDEKGETPLTLAIKRNNPTIVRYLL
jgi:ankyrin repeat protein